MPDYVYEKQNSHKVAYLVAIIVIIVTCLFLAYSWVFSFTEPLNKDQCSEKLTEWCNYCSSAIKSSGFIASSEPQKTAEKDVIECSNLYFDSGWTNDQSCTGTLNFCSGFIQRNQ